MLDALSAGPLRWLAMALLALSLPAFLMTIPSRAPDWAIGELHAIAHMLWFGLLGVFAPNLPLLRRGSRRRRAAVAMLAVLAFSLLIESLQTLTGRAAELHDVLLNLAAAGLGIALCLWGPAAWLVATLILLVVAAEPLASLVDRAIAWRAFPRLADFEQSLEASRWKHGARTNAMAYEGSHSLLLEFGEGGVPATSRMRSFGAWEAFDELAFAMHADRPVTLQVSIGDAEHVATGSKWKDRYDGKFPLAPGWNLVTVPLDAVRHPESGRRQDLDRIRRFVLFINRKEAPAVLHLDAMYLR